jgi:hypothetical protein
MDNYYHKNTDWDILLCIHRGQTLLCMWSALLDNFNADPMHMYSHFLSGQGGLTVKVSLITPWSS